MNKQELEKNLASVWKTPKMVSHCLKNSKYVELCGWFVNVCDSKPSIQNVMYYDDETEGPEHNKENFIAYNTRYSMPELCDSNKYRYFIQKEYYGQTTEKLAGMVVIRKWDDEPKGTIRELTTDDIKEINAGIEEVRTDYMKRLENYYKRYSDKITSCGYWRDR
jgi:hypothetical protein